MHSQHPVAEGYVYWVSYWYYCKADCWSISQNIQGGKPDKNYELRMEWDTSRVFTMLSFPAATMVPFTSLTCKGAGLHAEPAYQFEAGGWMNWWMDGWIRLTVGFQPLMVISLTASWIRWCMQVWACELMWEPVLFGLNDLRPTFFRCQATDSVPQQVSRKESLRPLILTPSCPVGCLTH